MFKKILILMIFLLSTINAVELYSHLYFLPRNTTTPNFVIDYKAEPKNETDWIAYYKTGSSVEWENVIAWQWTKELYLDAPASQTAFRFPAINLPNGEYEVRFFRNNSFIIDKSLAFTVDNAIEYLSLGEIIQFKENSANLEVTFKNRSENRTNKDWIGLFQSGKDHISQNVIAWKYLDEDRENGTINFIVHPRYWEKKTLEAVLFENDSYNEITTGKKTY